MKTGGIISRIAGLSGPADRIAAAGVLALFVLWMAATLWGSWSIDMSAVYLAGRMVADGDAPLIYATPPDYFSSNDLPGWREILDAMGADGRKIAVYVYPPIWAYLVAPLAGRMDAIAFFDATRIVMLASYAGAVVTAWRLMRPPVSLTAFALVSVVAAVTAVPFVFAAELNQPQLLVVFLTVLAFERYLHGRPLAAGVLLGIVAAIKIAPVLLCLIFAADRQWRAVAACLGTAAALMLASFAICGVELNLAFLAQARAFEDLVPLLGLNLTFETTLHDAFVPLSQDGLTPGVPLGRDTPWVTMLSRLLLIASVLGTLWLTRRLDPEARTRIRLIFVSTALIYFGPIGWLHYYMLPLLLLPGLSGVWTWPPLTLSVLVLVAAMNRLFVMAVLSATRVGGGEWEFYPQHLLLAPLVLAMTLAAVWALRKRPG